MSAPGYLGLLSRQVMCEEFSQCYDDVNICLWTDGLVMTRSDAQSACQQRNSFLARITNSSIQSKMADFRFAAGDLLGNSNFMIDVYTVPIDNFHWIDGSSLAS